MDTQIHYASIQEREFKRKHTPRIFALLDTGFKQHRGLSLRLNNNVGNSTSNIKIKGEQTNYQVSLDTIMPVINDAIITFRHKDNIVSLQNTKNEVKAAVNLKPFNITTILNNRTLVSTLNTFIGYTYDKNISQHQIDFGSMASTNNWSHQYFKLMVKPYRSENMAIAVKCSELYKYNNFFSWINYACDLLKLRQLATLETGLGFENDEFALAVKLFKKSAFLSNWSHFDQVAFYLGYNFDKNPTFGASLRNIMKGSSAKRLY